MFDPDTYRQESLATWDRMATGWEGRREWLLQMTGHINEWVREHVDSRARPFSTSPPAPAISASTSPSAWVTRAR